MIDVNFPVSDPLTGTCFDLTYFLKELLIDSWYSIAKSGNHTSDHSFRCILGSVISADIPEYIGKNRFTSMFDIDAR